MTDPIAADTAARPAGNRTTFMSLMTRERWIEVARILLTGLVAFLYWQQLIPVPVLWVAVAVGLYPLVKTGLIDLFTERKIGTELFVTVATIFALVGGEEVAGSVLMVIILIAEFIADLNTDRARASIQGLIGAVPTIARVRDNGQERVVPIAELHVDDVVLVRAGDSIPVDGTVVAGDGAADEASVTGESVPKDKSAGSRVFAGTILKSGALDVRTEAVGEQTTFARIVALVEDAEDSRAPVQKLADKVAAWLIPLIIVFLVVVFLVTRDVSMIVTLMIFTSPAELALATPMVIIAAIARAARSGILIKGGIYLESLARATTVVFDKTGTLTVGSPKVSAVRIADASVERDELLRLTAGLDRRSSHPLAEAIVTYVREAGVEIPEPTDFQVVPGRGVTGTVEGRALLVGNAALLAEAGIDVPSTAEATTVIHVAADGRLIGSFELEDQIRPGAKEAIAGLRVNGVKRIAMLTGDNAAVAGRVAENLGIDEVYADLLPEDKVDVISQMQARGERVAMVGDGINDAPALALAETGIAMGAGGTQAAIEAADVALMTDDLSKIVGVRAIARRAYRTIQENLFVGVGVVHVLGITAALLGWIGPIQAAIIHLGPDILVFLNSTKLLSVRIKTGPDTALEPLRRD
ncbi:MULTISPECIES: heavy metal translocating P-type ATPase [Micrococcales]|jgi:heavy metal translocating P-type ATPase|uniref:Cation-translocating P-type ATPase n=2 Tax=Micrococcales TaxID=85006 RepID=A0AAJ5VAV2_MICMQ|nr:MULTISPECIES: cation-translocating P-type ATPase [Micrococcales]AMG82909.1 exopolyphosphatase [Microbacterium sp. PAMC 28756]EXJ52043.1 exopolyphosphatase [Microbacterium sp. MRS-1]MDR6268444.1 heavy metal translocating P-type ATPase [Arthrobacter russicus]RBO70806.1 cadmium-translocating P-type ATPase [Microbacterium sp. H6]WEF20856.1 cation-translocating P-type ATPase [Microbacterium liquefaciens]